MCVEVTRQTQGTGEGRLGIEAITARRHHAHAEWPAKALADELDRFYQDEAISEGMAHAHESATTGHMSEAQSWLLAIFILARRLRGIDKS